MLSPHRRKGKCFRDGLCVIDDIVPSFDWIHEKEGLRALVTVCHLTCGQGGAL